MRQYILFVLFFFVLFSFSFLKKKEFVFIENIPWPKPIHNYTQTPNYEAKFQLGRSLFYDPLLSADSTISCSSCHLSFTGFAHVDHSLSHGINGQIGNRNAPALINLAWSPSFHWDGMFSSLESQSLNPIESPIEMNMPISKLEKTLNLKNNYKTMFYNAFGDSVIDKEKILNSLAVFVSALVSKNSKYDKVMRKDKGVSFTDQENRGYKIFQIACASCHQEPLFTNHSFKRNGLLVDSALNDLGRYNVTNNPKDSLLFKVPTLRNIQYTFPYMHDGRFMRLKEVIKHYSNLSFKNIELSKELRKMKALGEHEQKDLLSFLYTLSDKEFLFDKRFQFQR
ncbi:MAG: cytochrome c peroxidase [Crocinitomicaceae bacterium]|nr:cytochrome c peroxidase [Crocinitomicaceae bacterium]